MSIREALRAVGNKPGSISARARLAAELQDKGLAQSPLVWEAAAKIAAAKGSFFKALAICRMHLPRQAHSRFLGEMIRMYRGAAGSQVAPPGYQPRGFSFQIPLQEQAMLSQAIKVGTQLTGVLPAAGMTLPDIPVFGGMSDQLLLSLLHHVVPVPLRPGDAVIVEGRFEQSCYLLTQGRFRVTQKRKGGAPVELALIEAPNLVGEISILTRVSRRASVIADTVGMAWRLDARLLEHLGREEPKMIPEFRKLLKNRLVRNLVRTNPLFQELEESHRMMFLRSFDLIPVEPKAVLIPQGRVSPGLFILLHGEAVASQTGMDGRPRVVREFKEGTPFGAVSFLSQRPSQDAVSMPEGGIVLRLNPNTFKQLQRQIPRLEQALKSLARQGR